MITHKSNNRAKLYQWDDYNGNPEGEFIQFEHMHWNFNSAKLYQWGNKFQLGFILFHCICGNIGKMVTMDYKLNI